MRDGIEFAHPRHEPASGSRRLSAPRHHHLILPLLERELKDRYVGTGGGLTWALLQPLLMLGAYAFVFSYVFNIRVPGADGPLAYVTFVAVALWPWFLLQEGLLRALTALRGQATLVRKTALPRDLPVMVSVLAVSCIHLAGYVAVVLCLAGLGAPMRWTGLPLVVLSLASLLLALLAIGLVASVAQLVWRDLEHALQPALMLLFYATPILYPLALVPAGLQDVIAANPIAWWVERLRAGLLGGAMPGLADLVALVLALAALWAGRWLFLRVARQVEDLL